MQVLSRKFLGGGGGGGGGINNVYIMREACMECEDLQRVHGEIYIDHIKMHF